MWTQEICYKTNYVQVMRLLRGNLSLNLDVQLIEESRYTSFVCIKPKRDWSQEVKQPILEVRLYHDVRLAQVTKWHHIFIKQNEDFGINQLLLEWLNPSK